MMAVVYVLGTSGPIVRPPSDMLIASTFCSIAHSMPASTCASDPPFLPSSTSPHANLASGATPIQTPLASPPAIMPAQCVPC